MLAGPPPSSFNTSPALPTIQPAYQNPAMPPHFPVNQYGQTPYVPSQPPSFPPMMPAYSPQQFSQPPVASNGISQLPFAPPSAIPIDVSILVPPVYGHAGAPPAMVYPPYSQQPAPMMNYPVPNSNMGGMHAYGDGQYPGVQPTYNTPPPSFPSGGQPSSNGYPAPPQYPTPSSLSGPSMMPGMSQPLPNGPMQQPFPQARLETESIPNVVRTSVPRHSELDWPHECKTALGSSARTESGENSRTILYERSRSAATLGRHALRLPGSRQLSSTVRSFDHLRHTQFIGYDQTISNPYRSFHLASGQPSVRRGDLAQNSSKRSYPLMSLLARATADALR